jgi:transcriptional regulator with XRE-family HTH domain
MREKPPITPSQIRAGRALLGWSQEQLAKAANLSLSTVRDYEKERRGGEIGALSAIRGALENEGVDFTASEGDFGPGVRRRARVPNVLRWPVKLGRWDELLIPVEWRGKEYTVLVAHEVLEDLGRFSTAQPASESVRMFEEHRAIILQAAATAIDQGRVAGDRRVSLNHADFSDLH